MTTSIKTGAKLADYMRVQQFVRAMRYTEGIKKKLIALGQNPLENPISVSFEELPNAYLRFNWYTHTLELSNDGDDLYAPYVVVNVGDYILQNPHGAYKVITAMEMKEDYVRP